jgi:hypothetical protein
MPKKIPNYITLQDFNVHGANTTHGTESEVFRGVKREENPQYIEMQYHSTGSACYW